MESILELFEVHFKNPWVTGLIDTGIIVAFVSVIFLTSRRFVRPVIKRLTALFHVQSDEKIVESFLKLLKRLLVLIAASFIISSLPLRPSHETFFHNIIFIFIALSVLFGLFNFSDIVSLFVKTRAPEFEVLVSRVLKIFFATIVLMATMRHFDYDIWHIVTALGVGTLAVGLAAQPTLANMIAGFTILIDRPFHLGDRISLSTGESGSVVRIGLRSTHILNTEGNLLIISNNELVNSRVINYGFPNTSTVQKIKFQFEQDGGPRRIKELLKQVASKTPGIIPDSASSLITGINEWGGVELTVSFYVSHFSKVGEVTDSFMDAALGEFEKNQIRLATNPFSHPPR